MYYVVYALLFLLSLLPLRFLYLLSDFVSFLIYHVFGYRKKVVMDNLLLAFPEKTEIERKKIAKKFYRNLTDTFIEAIKMITVSDTFILKRFHANWEVINQFQASGKSIQLHLGHNFNWEWGNVAGAKNIDMPFLAVYMPISNAIINRLFYNLRSRSGTKLLRATNMSEDMIPYRNARYLLGLVADQNPGYPGNAWWFHFFGKPTPFLRGPAKNAISNDTVVIFAFIHKPRRGYYEAEFTVATVDPRSMTGQELTEKFVRYLEKVIRKNPSMWLWSHRRWKWEWKEEYGPVIS